MRALIFSVLLVVSAGSASAATDPVVVFLQRNGTRVASDDGVIAIPKFGGGDRAWTGIVGCVAEHFAPFQVEIVDRKPARGEFITAVVGGRASQFGLDDEATNGVGPYDGSVLRSAQVYVFSKVSGERDVANLCAVTAHEVAHALGLDHSTTCGDIMSYDLDACGTRRFMDVDAACGEGDARACGNGDDTQNSFRRLGALVGFKAQPAPEPEPDDDATDDIDPRDGSPFAAGGDDDDDEPVAPEEPDLEETPANIDDEAEPVASPEESPAIEPEPVAPEASEHRCGEQSRPRREHRRWRHR